MDTLLKELKGKGRIKAKELSLYRGLKAFHLHEFILIVYQRKVVLQTSQKQGVQDEKMDNLYLLDNIFDVSKAIKKKWLVNISKERNQCAYFLAAHRLWFGGQVASNDCLLMKDAKLNWCVRK